MQHATYSQIYSDVARFLNVKPGGSNATVPLDLINLAQHWLCNACVWKRLVKQYQLVLGANNTVVLPDDFDAVVRVFEDTDGDGQADEYYFENGDYDYGYEHLVTEWDNTTGTEVNTLTFFGTPGGDLWLDYVYRLPDFTGEGVEYSFFPRYLVVTKAKMIHIEGVGARGNAEYAIMERSFDKFFEEYKVRHQYVNADPAHVLKGITGHRIALGGYDLKGNASYNLPSSDLPSTDAGGRE